MDYGINPGLLLGARPPELPDPLALAMRGMSLAQMADSATQRKIAIQQAQQEQEAQRQMAMAVPLISSAKDPYSVLPQIGQQYPLAYGKILEALKKQEETQAGIEEKRATAAEKTTNAKAKIMNDLGNTAFGEAKNPNAMSLPRIQAMARFYGIDLPPFQGDPQNPQHIVGYMQSLGNSAYAIKDQVTNAETAAQNKVTNALNERKFMSEDERRKAETSQGWAKIDLERANANKMQNVSTPEGTLYAFNPKTGAYTQGRDEAGKPIAGTKPLTESQSQATAYGMRMKSSNDIIGGLEQSGFDIGSLPNRYLPESLVGNYIADPRARQAYAAKLNFMTASLRKESGAVISPSEFESENKKYFPQPGDDPTTRDQKRQARELALRAMSVQAGPGSGQISDTQSGTRVASGQIKSGPPPLPKVGEVRDGWRYTGGDPGNQSSWQKVSG